MSTTDQRAEAERPRASDGLPRFADRDARGHWVGVGLGMVWLVIPIAETLGDARSAVEIALAVLLFTAAAAAYLIGMAGEGERAPRRRISACIAVLTVAAIVLTVVVAPSWAILFTYSSALSGLCLPARAAAPLFLGSTALAIALNLHEGVAVALSFGASTLGLGALMLALGGLMRANASLRDAHAQIRELAVEAERERFARDLHDLLGHSLSVITLKAELAGRLLPDRPDEARRHVGELEGVARAALGEVRETVSGYRKPTLAGELAGARIALDAAGIEFRLREPGAQQELPAEVEAVLAWAVREGTTNVIRHSGARRCEIAIEPRAANGHGPGAVAEIRDDGAGTGGGRGNGLAGLRERAAQLSGRVEAGTRPEGGFVLRVVVPLQTGGAA